MGRTPVEEIVKQYWEQIVAAIVALLAYGEVRSKVKDHTDKLKELDGVPHRMTTLERDIEHTKNNQRQASETLAAFQHEIIKDLSEMKGWMKAVYERTIK